MKFVLKPFLKIFHLRYKGVYRHAKKLFLIDMGLLALALLMLATSIFFFFWEPGVTELVDLNISVGDERVLSGDYVQISIKYRNRSEIDLVQTALSLELPAGFIIDQKKTPSTNFDRSIFTKITSIKSGQSDTVELWGWYWGQPNSEQNTIARLSYLNSETDKKEQKVSRVLLRLPDTRLKGILSLSDKSLTNSNLDYSYQLTNSSSNKIDNITLKQAWLEKKSEMFLSLEANSNKIVTGTIKTPANIGDYALYLEPLVVIDNQQISQGNYEKIVNVISPDITSAVNFDENEKYVDQGKKIPLIVSWQNRSTFPLNSMEIQLTANYPHLIDWQKTAWQNGIRTINNSLIIDQYAKSKLKTIKTGASDQFEIDLYFLANYTLGQLQENYLEITPKITAIISDFDGQTYQQTGQADRLPIATQVTSKGEVRFYTDEGDQIGHFPLPPQVGHPTTYWAFLQINNGHNALKDVSITGQLAPNVQYNQIQSVTLGKKIEFTNSQFSWKHDLIEANSWAGLRFGLTVTPSADNAGEKLTLSTPIYIKATDIVTGKKIDISLSSLDNILPNSDKGSKKGYLVEK